jgi:hypothetical protein
MHLITGRKLSPITPTKLIGKEWLVAPLLLFAGSLVLLLVYLQHGWMGKRISSAQAISWNGDALAMSKGQGSGENGKLVIAPLEEKNVAVAALSPQAFQAEDYAVVNWAITGAKPEIDMEMLWRSADGHIFASPVAWSSNSVTSVRMAEDINWRGQVTYLALVVKGPLAVPITLNEVALEPASPQAALLHTAKSWLAFEPWQGSSINYLGGNTVEEDASPVLVVAAIIFLALALYLIVAKFKIQPLNIAVIWGIFFLGWFALDARWQSNLFRQTYLTYMQFSGKSWEDKRRSDEDGKLFDLMQQIKVKLQPTQSRVFLFADDEYTLHQGAYHLFPLNVMKSRDLLMADQFKSGDYIIIMGKDEVDLDPARHLLKWEPHQQLKADLLLLAANNVLVRAQ